MGIHPFTDALMSRDLEKLVDILILNTDINELCPGLEMTALHFAVQQEWMEAVKLLITMGADVNAEDKQGRTPLQRIRFLYPLMVNHRAIPLLIEAGGK